jgi:hypothetical protein
MAVAKQRFAEVFKGSVNAFPQDAAERSAAAPPNCFAFAGRTPRARHQQRHNLMLVHHDSPQYAKMSRTWIA